MSSRGARLWGYVVEMYPLHVNVPYSFVLFFGYYLLLQAIYGMAPLRFTRESLLGALTLACFTLLLRVFDEFKDYEHDVKLFPHRPLPSGRVTKADLTVLGWTLAAVMTALNALLGGKALAGYALLMAFALLMLKFFFLPDLHRRSLLLTLCTHNPVAVFTHLYVLGVFFQAHGIPLDRPVPAGAWLGILMFWGLIFAWETARKIRSPEEEDDYVTYSRLLGTKRAPLVPAFALTMSFGLAVWFAWTLALSPILPVVLVLAWTYAMTAFSRFVAHPAPTTSKLRPYVETASLVLYAALLVALPVRFGLERLF
ncbi:MAG: UbiA family prenyltransferase [Candidatus Sericytochromatia bacterium]|nr:UbiA family prenyltransferase [Candidatus Tanganyikabacteria bacterium]